MRELFCYRYKNVELLFRGVRDYLKGVDFLKKEDGEKLNQEIMGLGYKAVPVEELTFPFDYNVYKNSFGEWDHKFHKLYRYLMLNGLLFPANRNNIVSMTLCRPINFYRAKQVLQYDESSRKAFLTERDTRKAIAGLIGLAGLTCQIILEYDRKRVAFQKESEQIMKEEFWNEYLK